MRHERQEKGTHRPCYTLCCCYHPLVSRTRPQPANQICAFSRQNNCSLGQNAVEAKLGAAHCRARPTRTLPRAGDLGRACLESRVQCLGFSISGTCRGRGRGERVTTWLAVPTQHEHILARCHVGASGRPGAAHAARTAHLPSHHPTRPYVSRAQVESNQHH